MMVQTRLQDLTGAWQQINHHPGGSSSSSAIRGVKMLIEAWNHNFFLRRAVYFRFSKARGRHHHRRSRRGSRFGSDMEHEYSEDSDDLSSEDDDDELYDEEDDGRYGRSRKRPSRRRREDVRYRLICEFIAPSPGAGRGGLPSGYPGYA